MMPGGREGVGRDAGMYCAVMRCDVLELASWVRACRGVGVEC